MFTAEWAVAEACGDGDDDGDGSRTNSVFIESRRHALGSLSKQGEEWQSDYRRRRRRRRNNNGAAYVLTFTPNLVEYLGRIKTSDGAIIVMRAC